MSEDKKKGYPKIPLNNWFLLREKFKQRAPERVSPSYVATALGMGEASASANIIPPLKAFGLLDEAGKPTDLAYDWRDDSKYPQVCKIILDTTYPPELRDLFHDTSADLKDIANWFARNSRVGESAARGYAATYFMLLEADLTRGKEAGATKKAAATPRSAKPSPAKATAPKPSVRPKEDPRGGAGTGEDKGGNLPFTPKLHVDIQIHISPDSSAEQIDKIFESMAKHLSAKA